MRTFELFDKRTGEVTFAGVEASRSRRCPVCQHDSWCLIDAARRLTICPRIMSPRKIGEAGWIHSDSGEVFNRAAFSQPKPRPPFNAALMQPMLRALKPHQIVTHAHVLGVTASSLMDLEMGWDEEHGAYAFPMRDGTRNIIGIRLRKPDGFKFAIENSRNGLFYPELKHVGPIMLPEGPTDTAAMLSLRFDVIGRPFCRGGISMLQEAFDKIKRPAVIIADQDKVGIEGAEATADALFGIVPVKVIKPPPTMKDAREWVKAGATYDTVMYRVEQTSLWTARKELGV